MKEKIITALEMSLCPDDNTIQAARKVLDEGKTFPGFVKSLLEILVDPQVSLQIRTASVCTAKDLVFSHYECREGSFSLLEEDKAFLKSSVFQVFAQVQENRALRKTYEEIVSRLVQVDFPAQWACLPATLFDLVKSSQSFDSLIAPLSVLRLVMERYQPELDEKRAPLRLLQNSIFPLLENAITCQIDWSCLDAAVKAACLQILKCFNSAIFTQIDDYYQGERFKLWMFFLKKVYDCPVSPEALLKPQTWARVVEAEALLDWKVKKACGQIVSKVLQNVRTRRRRGGQQAPDFSAEFFSQYCHGFLDTSINFIKLGMEGFVPQKTLQFCFKALFYALQEKEVIAQMTPHLDYILFDICVPMLGANQKDSENWKEDPAAFLYSQESRLDGHNLIKYASKDLIDQILRLENQHKTPMAAMLLDFTNACFSTQVNPRTQQPLTPSFKECLISLMIHCFKQFDSSDDPLLGQAEQLIENHMLAELGSEHELIKVRMCTLLHTYGAHFIGREESVFVLCRGLELCMNTQEVVVQINGLIALNKALSNQKVCQLFAQHVSVILELVVKCMNQVDYKELVYAAEGIIKDLDRHVLPFAGQLLQHFQQSFYRYLENAKSEKAGMEDSEDEDDSELEANTVYESIYAAEACLEAILSILQLEISPSLREDSNNLALRMVCDIVLEGNGELFTKSLSLLNFVLFKAESLTDAMLFFFPVLCYMLNPKPRGQLSQAAAVLPENFLKVLTECNLGALSEGLVTSSLGCFLNYTCKMGASFFTAVDYHGVLFVDLFFDTVVLVIKNALSGPSDTDIVFMLRIIVGLLEQSKGRFEVPRLHLFLEMVLNLCEFKRSDSLSLHILQTVSMFIWHSPAAIVHELKKANRLESFYSALLAKINGFAEEQAKERILYGFAGLLELPPEEAKSMNVELVMKAVVKVAEDLTRLRLADDSAPKETHPSEIDLGNEDKEFEDDEDDDFDDADEELEAAENDDKYRFTSPLDQYCPLLYLQTVLAGLEKNSPDYFKFVMSTLTQDQTTLLLQCISSSQDYIQKLKEAIHLQQAPDSAQSAPNS